jgi:mycothiol synthase
MPNKDHVDRPDELDRIAEFVRAYPQASQHVVDLPYRLASHAAQDSANRRLWLGANGHILGYALAQLPMWTLDDALTPGQRGSELERDVLRWGIERWRAIAANGGPGWMFVDAPEDDANRQTLLTSLGIARDEWYQLHLAQPLQVPIPASEAPHGFTLRPLAGEAEVEAYVALHRAAFGSENMTVAWRRQTLAMPEYHPDLDLVAAAADGRLAGFCIGWLATIAGRVEAQIEPVGVHPNFQGQGLGRALIAENLRRFQAAGAERAHIEVDGNNDAARRLYASAGFRPTRTILKYGMRM